MFLVSGLPWAVSGDANARDIIYQDLELGSNNPMQQVIQGKIFSFIKYFLYIKHFFHQMWNILFILNIFLPYDIFTFLFNVLSSNLTDRNAKKKLFNGEERNFLLRILTPALEKSLALTAEVGELSSAQQWEGPVALLTMRPFHTGKSWAEMNKSYPCLTGIGSALICRDVRATPWRH